MANLKLAFDRSARRIDADGRLHVDRSHISKAMVNPYYGKEIPGFEEFGLQPDTIYRLLRDPVELERGAPTFARLPILSEHVPVTVDTPRPELVVGAIGSDVIFEMPYLDADICIWDADAIAGIDTDTVRELSCAYRYVPVMEPGEFEGEPYDGRMTEIKGNHLALVTAGRAGSDVVVSDSALIEVGRAVDKVKADSKTFKESAMKMTKLGKALFAALCAASPKLAADSALPALVGPANRKTFKKDDIKSKLIALDAELDPQQLDNVIDALLDVEQEPKAKETPMAAADESPADKLRKLLAGKVDESVINEACALMGPPSEDENPETPGASLVKETTPKQPNMAAAMDSMSVKIRTEMREANEAARDVRDVVGDVIGMDSAAEIYGFALDQMKIDRTDVKDAPALRALFKIASRKVSPQTATVAQDAAGAVVMFPALSRLKQA